MIRVRTSAEEFTKIAQLNMLLYFRVTVETAFPTESISEYKFIYS